MNNDKEIIIIPHSIREKKDVEIQKNNRRVKVRLLFDGMHPSNINEDPFIFNECYLYSFCHANNVITKELENKYREKEIYLIFVSFDNVGECSNSGKKHIYIDTVIKVDKIIEYAEKYKRTEENIGNELSNYFSESSVARIIACHFPEINDGELSQHDTQRLRTIIGDRMKSFIPLKKCGEKFSYEYEPYRLDEKLSCKIKELICGSEKNYQYYVAKKSSPRIIEDKCKLKKFKDVETFVLNNLLVEDNNILKLRGKDLKGEYDR